MVGDQRRHLGAVGRFRELHASRSLHVGGCRIHGVLGLSADTIFVTDHFQPAAAGKPLNVNTMGFKLVDAAAARESVRRVLALNPRRLVTSHGGRDACVREAAEIAPAYDVLLEAHGVPPD